MRVAVLYICTGQYDKFWPEFHSSAERHFCTGHERQYFVFTDSKNIAPREDVVVVPQDNLGWPFNTLYRFRMFLRIRQALENFDKVVFFNSNCVFIQNVEFNEFFGNDMGLLGCLHPGFHDKPPAEYTYEKRETSTAFVRKGKRYYAGGIIGGSPDRFLEACVNILKNIEIDLDNGLMAIWHDESHWNAYVNDHFDAAEGLQALPPSYLHPQGQPITPQTKILLRKKINYIDTNRIKQENIGAKKHIKLWLRRTLNSLRRGPST